MISFKKTIIFSLVTALTLGVSGCSNKQTVATNTTINTSTDSVVKTDEQKAEDKEEIKIPPKKEEPLIINYTGETLVQNIGLSEVFVNGNKETTYNSDNNNFPDIYSDNEGVLAFRGNNLRNSPSYGIANVKENKLEKIWEFQTSSSSWGGGAGWTGQPSIIKWNNNIKQIMNIKDKFKSNDNFKEVIYASLDGNIYFFDLDSGEQSRNPIKTGNPIKGSVSIDSRGYPLLYSGQGIPEKSEIGYRIYSLIDQSMLYFIKGMDSQALRGWGAFDGSGLINRDNDTLIEGGENGIVYKVKLNTKFDNNAISINPQTTKYRYKVEGNSYQGIENSIAGYKNFIYFADNGGSIQSVDLNTMKPQWVIGNHDDTDSTITLDVVQDIPFIYTGSEVDKQGSKGYSYVKKIDGRNGKTIWESKYECESLLGDSPVNGGLLATNVIGKKDIDNLVIFSFARSGGFNSGLMVALDKNTGKEVWKFQMPNYAWSSPVDIYDENGKSYIVQCDSIGNIYLLEGKTGNVLTKLNLGSNIEASPSIFNDTLVIATRGGKMYGVKIK